MLYNGYVTCRAVWIRIGRTMSPGGEKGEKMGNRIWMPSIVEMSHDGVREIDLYTKHLMNRRIFLCGELDCDLANGIFSQILYLTSEGDEPIDIFINSDAGEVRSGLLVYDMLQSVRTPVNLYCIGTAAGMAALILAGGQKGRRFMLPHAKTELREPSSTGEVGGFSGSSHHAPDAIPEIRRTLRELLALHTGRTAEEIAAAMDGGRYRNAEESVAFGLCDAIREEIG